ncbi:MAG: RNA methyltransferase [Eubacteriales bacterium]|nr:RNA methyltransferase [Eubacteriales bacterium]
MITSTSSSQVRHVISLLGKARERKKYKEYVVEGVRMVSEIPSEMLVKAYISEKFADSNPGFVKDFIRNKCIEKSAIELVSDHIFNRMSDTRTPQGIMAVVRMREYSLEDLMGENPLIIGMENIQDPGNMGTILRMGEAAGATGVMISSNSVDIYNPKTIRSTMGSLYRVPFIVVEDFQQGIMELKNKRVKVYAAHLDGRNCYTEEDYTGATAFIIGNEGNGITEKTASECDTFIKIPMEGQVESLNAAIACTILSFEAARQRR